MPKGQKKPKVVPPKKTKEFLTTLLVGGKEYKYETNSVMEALDKLNPETIKGKGVFTVDYEGKSRTVVLNPLKLKRLVNNQMTRNFLAKQINIAIGAKTLEDYI